FATACEQRSGRLLPYVSTQDSARDMDAIRAALGEDKISYFGFSYGSQLGGTYATMFPGHVRAMTIDGSIDQNATWDETLKNQLLGLELGLKNMLDDCAQQPSCAFYSGGNPMSAYEALQQKLTTNPVMVDPSRPPVSNIVLGYAVLSGL